MLDNLGLSLMVVAGEPGEEAALQEAARVLTEVAAAASGPARIRLDTHRQLGHIAMTAGDGAAALAAFEEAIALLRQVSPRHLAQVLSSCEARTFRTSRLRRQPRYCRRGIEYCL
jgi:ATP/maltotriose-dependent transcriptional regulator MalT